MGIISFNYFNFVPEKSCFIRQFGMAGGCKYYTTHEPHINALSHMQRKETRESSMQLQDSLHSELKTRKS